MARKITLTVPDSLYSRIQLWRSAFNLSRIFQDAVAEAIRRKEEFQKRLGQDASLTEIIQRLRREKVSFEQRTRLAAAEEGRHWASRAHYAELVVAVHTASAASAKNPAGAADQAGAASTPPAAGATRFGPDDPALQEPIARVIESLREEHQPGYRSSEEYRLAVVAGWYQGVRDFWDTVRDRI